MRLISRIAVIIFFFLSSFLYFVPPAHADGSVSVYHYDKSMRGEWRYGYEQQQLCMINYQGGLERMMLSIDANTGGDRAVWIFPVPAPPEQIGLDITGEFPVLRGMTIESKAKGAVQDAFMAMAGSQIFTVPFFLFSAATAGGGSGGVEQGVTVHQHLEKMGLTSELVSAEDVPALQAYLAGYGLDLSADSGSMLGDYIGRRFSFVVTWMSDPAKNAAGTGSGGGGGSSGKTIWSLGVCVSFPTSEIYYPLKPTAVYGDTVVPLLLYVFGSVTPELYPEIERKSYREQASYSEKTGLYVGSGTDVEYFCQDYVSLPGDASLLFDGKDLQRNVHYTRIRIALPSRYFVDDLWINPAAPARIKVQSFLGDYVSQWGVALFMLLSMLASLIAGKIAFARSHPGAGRLALFGLLNFGTLLVLSFFTACININVFKPRGAGKGEGKPPHSKASKLHFIILFMVIFLFLTGACYALLSSLY